MLPLIIINGTLAETPEANQYGFYHLRVNIPVNPNHPYVKGEQWMEIEASSKNPACKLLEKMTKGSSVIIHAEQTREHYHDKGGTPRTSLRNRLLRISYAPLSHSRQQQMQELQHTATADQSRADHYQSKANAYQPTHEADADIPF